MFSIRRGCSSSGFRLKKAAPFWGGFASHCFTAFSMALAVRHVGVNDARPHGPRTSSRFQWRLQLRHGRLEGFLFFGFGGFWDFLLSIRCFFLAGMENVSPNLVTLGFGLLVALCFSWESLAGTHLVPSLSTFSLGFAFFQIRFAKSEFDRGTLLV